MYPSPCVNVDHINKLYYTFDYDAVGRLRRQFVFDVKNENVAGAKLYEFEKIYDTAGRVSEIWYVTYTGNKANPVQKYKHGVDTSFDNKRMDQPTASFL